MKRSAFTLLEVIVVIIIVGALASLALPKFANLIEASRTTEAIAMVSSIRVGLERCYLMRDGSYQDCDSWWGDDSSWGNLGIGNPSRAPNSHFRYEVRTGKDYYAILCMRMSNMGDPLPAGPNSCYYIVMGLGVKPLPEWFVQSNDSCSAAYEVLSDGKIYWGGLKSISGLLPKTN